MEMRVLGSTGVRVSPLCLGAMMFGSWGNTDHDESARIIHRALDAGLNFIDTAQLYGPLTNEELVGRAVAGHREDYVIATKFARRTDKAKPGDLSTIGRLDGSP